MTAFSEIVALPHLMPERQQKSGVSVGRKDDREEKFKNLKDWEIFK